jgi:XTP/dITP diphosphohydrolase
LKFLLASGNKHKAEEFSVLLPKPTIQVESAPVTLKVDETGSSYFENAELKARSYFERFQKPVFADDSGLNVDALPGELGIYSARFGGEEISQTQRNRMLLEKMLDVSDRTASFTCVLCFYLSPEEIFFFEGNLNGRISENQIGDEGFGYDPLFIPEGQSFSLASNKEWKDIHSHRARACKHAVDFFTGRLP